MSGDAPADPPRAAVWPPGAEIPEGEGVAAPCGACGLAWTVHPSLAGFRLRCRCGEWVPVPAAPATAARRGLPGGPASAALAREGQGAAWDLARHEDPAPAPPRELAHVRSWDGGPLRPEPGGGWTLRHASAEDRARWSNRTALELALILACFWVPALVLELSVDAARRAFWMPAAGVLASALVLVVAATGRRDALRLVRRGRVRHFVEAGALAVGAALLAVGWVEILRSRFPGATSDLEALRTELGLPVTLCVVSLLPAVFEEIAFRGVFHARLAPLLGTTQAALVGGAAFALAHGITTGLPFHWGLGVYLSFLRVRTGTLVPGMLCHALYNGVIVLAVA